MTWLLLSLFQTLRQTFNVAVQTKNKIIQTLLADLDDSVAMHNLAVQTHLESINKIIGIRINFFFYIRTCHITYQTGFEKKNYCSPDIYRVSHLARALFKIGDSRRQKLQKKVHIKYCTIFGRNSVNLILSKEIKYKYKPQFPLNINR